MTWLTHTPGKGTLAVLGYNAEQHFNTPSSVKLQVSAHKLNLYIYKGQNFRNGENMRTALWFRAHIDDSPTC